MPENLTQTASDRFLKEWKTFTLVVLALVGTWYGIYLDMFDASLWNDVTQIGVFGYISRTVLKSGINAWKESKTNGSAG